MKIRLFSLFLAAVLTVPTLSGCQAANSVDRSVERAVESIGNTVKQAVDPTTATSSGTHKNPALTLEDAQSIALRHAGFTADQVTALHTECKTEHGVPRYDVEFHHGAWEYDYEIHGDTGEILSYSKDD